MIRYFMPWIIEINKQYQKLVHYQLYPAELTIYEICTFIATYEQISHIVMMFLLLTQNK